MIFCGPHLRTEQSSLPRESWISCLTGQGLTTSRPVHGGLPLSLAYGAIIPHTFQSQITHPPKWLDSVFDPPKNPKKCLFFFRSRTRSAQNLAYPHTFQSSPHKRYPGSNYYHEKSITGPASAVSGRARRKRLETGSSAPEGVLCERLRYLVGNFFKNSKKLDSVI